MAVFNGGPEPNNHVGTGGDDEIDGGGGDDTLHDGGGGHDVILGGTGADLITGTNGEDTLEGGDGNDTIASGEDADLLSGGIGHDVITDTGGGNDTLTGGDGNDSLTDLFGTLLVSSGADLLDGGNGNDTLRAGTGDDTLIGGAGIDWFDGGPHSGSQSQTDHVADFTLGIDRIDLRSIGISEFATVQALFTEIDGSLAIQYRTSGALQTLILDGVAPDTALSAADFVFSTDPTAQTISGGTASDDIFGGRGNDAIFGFEGDSRLWGEHGNDTLIGHETHDQLFGGNDDDSLNGGSGGNDILDGGAGNDTLTDSGIFSGNDTLRGGAGQDRLAAGLGNDVLNGGEGRDFFDAGPRRPSQTQTEIIEDFTPGQDKIDLRTLGIADWATARQLLGSSGADAALVFLAGGAAQTWTFLGIAPGTLSPSDFVFNTSTAGRFVNGETSRDDLFGGRGHDTVFGNESNDRLWGAAGDDSLNGGADNDTLDGGAGLDTLAGGSGDDTYVNPGSDIIVESAGPTSGIDTVFSNKTFSLAVHPDVENLILSGAAAINATGNARNNQLTGNGAANVLSGGDGLDTLTGGLGNDTYIDPGADVIVELAGGGRDSVRSQTSVVLGEHLEDLVLLGVDTLTGTGNAAANRITGNDGANMLQGLAGNDTLVARNGADTLAGGEGNDTLTGGSQGDVFRFAATASGADRITDFNPNADRFQLSGGTFSARKIAGADTILVHDGGTIRIEGIANLSLGEWNALVVPGGEAAAIDGGLSRWSDQGRFAPTGDWFIP